MKLFLLILLLASSVSVAQISGVRAIGSNLLRIGEGETDDQLTVSRKRYLEEIANLRVFFENITVGLRYEISDPSEVGRNFQGLRRRWIEYKKDGLELQAGDVYALYGRGLAVNMFESRPLNYDSWLDGFSGSFNKTFAELSQDLKPNLTVNAIGGNKLFYDIDTTKPPLDIAAWAGNGQIGLFGKKVNLGFSFLQAFTETTEPGFGNTLRTSLREVNQPEYYISFLSGPIEGFFGFTEMRTNLNQVRNNPDSARSYGKAKYGTLSYAQEDFGITFEYKDYEYFVHAPGVRNETYLGKLPLSSPPEVYKEFTYTSITRTTHAVNFNDEIGFQLEANITAIPDITITLNGAASSTHFREAKDSSGNIFLVDKVGFLPEMSDNAYKPFWEVFAEVEYELADLNYFKLFAHRRYDAYEADKNDARTSTTFGFKMQLETAESQSFLGSVEYQQMHDVQSLRDDKSPQNLYVVGQYSFTPIITFGGIFDFSTDYNRIRHIWPQVFASTRIGGSHTILASYGAERGGINCTGGICRFVPPFYGFRLTITSQI